MAIGSALLLGCTAPSVSPEPSASPASFACPVTRPDPQITPPPIVDNAPPGILYGNAVLWVGLPPGGEALLLRQPDGTFSRKFMWWRLKPGRLTLEAKRLDAATPLVHGDVDQAYGESGFQATGIAFSSEGCWEITGRLGSDSLSFVILVKEKP